MSTEAYHVDGVFVRIRPSRTRKGLLLGLAKAEPFVLAGADPVFEPGEVWFQYGVDRADLVDALVAEVLADTREESE